MKDIIAVTLGDRNGIGPEITARLMSDWKASDAVVPVVVGDGAVFERACKVAGVSPSMRRIASLTEARAGGSVPLFLDMPFAAPLDTVGQVSAAAGGEVLYTLEYLVGQARLGTLDGIVYAPLNKQAMAIAGHVGADEAELFGRLLEGEASEINVLDKLSTSRVTSHVPVGAVAGLITRETVLAAILRMRDFLLSIGVEQPRLAVAGLNPHAGEGGVFGKEEIEIIEPAIRELNDQGMLVEGPFPADTIFPRVLKGGYDAIVTMYHDQGQIALKLLGLGRGVTVIGGLCVPIATAGHGTAFDIAGKGIASAEGLAAALDLCVRIVAGRRAAHQQITNQLEGVALAPTHGEKNAE
ncbi:PdxA family dehydrogenase [Rhizobium sp. CF142]|uniref:PdxA family dehydrogenase n=1 Tax=Rhizobium sp. CF142 TaxID=1144314 RepID=UPI00026EECAA|nr:4-hydroxythreonine-4-phosphate dehydrogenase PdxA [Rhizobium sp. CF142]EJJ31521.1 pyridoxal phosphate biosynthesis protein [Rhizobium sp. CF142]